MAYRDMGDSSSWLIGRMRSVIHLIGSEILGNLALSETSLQM